MADSIDIVNEDGINYLLFNSDESVVISGYIIQLNYTSETKILELNPISPFMGTSNIQNSEGFAKVVGFTGELNSPNILASFKYSGSDDIDILVIDLRDNDIQKVTITNPTIELRDPVESTLDPVPYPSSVGYISPSGNGVETKIYDEININYLVSGNSVSDEIITETPISISTITVNEVVEETNLASDSNQSSVVLTSLEDNSIINKTILSESQQNPVNDVTNQTPIGLLVMIVGIILIFIINRKDKKINN